MTDTAPTEGPTPEQLEAAWRAAFTDITEVPVLPDGAACLWTRTPGLEGSVLVQCWGKVGDMVARYSQAFALDAGGNRDNAAYNGALAEAFVIGAMKAFLAEHGVNP